MLNKFFIILLIALILFTFPSVVSEPEIQYREIAVPYLVEVEVEIEIPVEKLVYVPTATKSVEFLCTAYCSCYECCGKWSQYGLTSMETTPRQGWTIAVDKNVIPLGTKVYAEGLGVRLAEDEGVKGNRIDFYFQDHQEALNFAEQILKIWILEG